MSNWLRSGLELQLIALETAMNDPTQEEPMQACIVCFELAPDCVCGDAQISWEISHAIRLLKSTISELTS